ncbi:uncharacterized protein MONOS_18548 [Monocercomonoides exilis]|uniref:uncharacterized protein n=1 Tax=Monocercomonoides exilis TaxID=2049356 RepID=UPI0035597147|nr:hypothetical protein MONOS_18548 [Monocercomonoides exilis]
MVGRTKSILQTIPLNLDSPFTENALKSPEDSYQQKQETSLKSITSVKLSVNSIENQSQKIDDSFNDIPFERATDSCVIICANTAVGLVSPFVVSAEGKTSNDELQCQNKDIVTQSSKDLFSKILHFFNYTRSINATTSSELIIAMALLHRIVRVEKKRVVEGHTSIISHKTLGTILLCSIILSQKLLRDKPFKNSWWSRHCKVPISIINDSEEMFLKLLDYRLHVSDEDFALIYGSFIERASKCS